MRCVTYHSALPDIRGTSCIQEKFCKIPAASQQTPQIFLSQFVVWQLGKLAVMKDGVVSFSCDDFNAGSFNSVSAFRTYAAALLHMHNWDLRFLAEMLPLFDSKITSSPCSTNSISLPRNLEYSCWNFCVCVIECTVETEEQCVL